MLGLDTDTEDNLEVLEVKCPFNEDIFGLERYSEALNILENFKFLTCVRLLIIFPNNQELDEM